MQEDYLEEFKKEQRDIWAKHLLLVALTNLVIIRYATYCMIEENWDCWV